MLSSYLEGRLYGSESGAAPFRVLALHGWARTHADFADVVAGRPGAALSALAVDLPGFGASPPPPAAWGSADYAELLDQLLDTMAERVVVVGHSFGGRVAVELAARRPGRVAGLVLTGVPLFRQGGSPARPKLAYRAVRAAARLGIVGPASLERARERYGSEDYRRAVGVMRGVLTRVVNENYQETLARIECPTELVWGADDPVAPPAVAELALEALKAAHLTLVSGADHFVPTSAPKALREAIDGLVLQ